MIPFCTKIYRTYRARITVKGAENDFMYSVEGL